MKLEDILQMEDVNEKIAYLKKGRKTPLPDAAALYDDWNPNRHEIVVNKDKYPPIRIQTQPASIKYDEVSDTTVKIPAKYETVEPNRISVPIEQDIVNIQTAFTVGESPKNECNPIGDEEKVLKILESVCLRNKIAYHNKKVVRSWLSEQEVAEYWYTVNDDENFWEKLKRKIGLSFGSIKPESRLKSVVWSPFKGDKLYPFFNDENNLIAFSREYKKKDIDGNQIQCFMTITSSHVYEWETATTGQWVKVKDFRHGFKKMPIIYAYRPEAYCKKIRALRIRLEKLLSNYGDCIDYHFFPILKLYGEVTALSGNFKNRVAQLTGEKADAQYLTWNQASETVKLELENLTDMIYSMTNTPRVMPEQLKGLGSSLSGVAFKYVFLGAHLSVENHAEDIGEFLQRRTNFLIHAIGELYPSLRKDCQTIEVTVMIQPYTINSVSDNVATAVHAVQGGVWSRREGIAFAGNADRVEEELSEINIEMQNLLEQKNNAKKVPY